MGVSDLGVAPFRTLPALQTVTVAEDNPYFVMREMALYQKSPDDSSTEILINVLPAFHGSLTIPDNCIEIAAYAMYGCGDLTEVEIPTSVTLLGDLSMAECTSLRNLKIPDGITRLPDGLLQGCTQITRVDVPSTVKFIGIAAFADCESLRSVILPASLIGFSGLQTGLGTELKEFNQLIPAFYRCKNLKSVYFLGNPPSPACITYSNSPGAYCESPFQWFSGPSGITVYYPEETPGWPSDEMQNSAGRVNQLPFQWAPWEDARLAEDGWRLGSWMGNLQDTGLGYIFHPRHGFLYLGLEGNAGLEFYDPSLQRWLYTSRDLYPFLYVHELDSWYYFIEDSGYGDDRIFYDVQNQLLLFAEDLAR